MENKRYPRLLCDLPLLRRNVEEVTRRCHEAGIRVAGVVKGVNAQMPMAEQFARGGCDQLASSRLDQIERVRRAGLGLPTLLIRIPMMSELEDVARFCDYSLESDLSVLEALNGVCLRQGVRHKVILMADLGDLREGFWDKNELVEVCARVERELPHVHLAGIGVNLTCYGSTKPTPEKMHELLALRRRIEARIGRTLEVASGGATSSFTLVHWGTMPEGIDHLRIGEAILLGKDLQVDWGIRDMDYLQMDALTLRAEVIEVKDKPTYPIGEFAIDAFGRKPVYEDRGVRRRAILALGRADVGELESLIPREPGLTVIGGSSDHCIVDVEDCPRHLEVGDVVEFSLCYSHMLYATARSDMRINFKHIQEAE